MLNRITVSLVAVLALLTLLHSGRTDGNGGHYNRSTGEYHYHHGQGPHDHYDIDGDGIVDCPIKYYRDTPRINKVTFSDAAALSIAVIIFLSYPAVCVIVFVFEKSIIFIEKISSRIANKKIKISLSSKIINIVIIILYVAVMVGTIGFLIHLKKTM